MLMLLSPAKRMDFETPARTRTFTEPDLLDDAELLVKTLRNRSKKALAELMDVSDAIAAENHERYQQWRRPFTAENARPAVLSFAGDVYQGLDAPSMKAADLKFAQKRLRILSGLYGVLRPLDLIQPYRLEMRTSLKTRRGEHLYAFWGERITEAVQSAMRDAKTEELVNLASNEYFRSVNVKRLEGRLVSPAFRERKNGKLLSMSFFAKRARGMMARWAIDQRIEHADELKSFDMDRYAFDELATAAAKPGAWVFSREYEGPK